MTLAVSTHDLIGQAKGILIECHKITGDQDFSLLVRASRRTSTKLVHITEYLVHSGELLSEPRP